MLFPLFNMFGTILNGISVAPSNWRRMKKLRDAKQYDKRCVRELCEWRGMGVSLRHQLIKNQNRKITSGLSNLFLFGKLVPDWVQDSKRRIFHVQVANESENCNWRTMSISRRVRTTKFIFSIVVFETLDMQLIVLQVNHQYFGNATQTQKAMWSLH